MATFSNDFLWGGDISATQIEGGWDEGGKSPVETDYMVGVTHETPFRYGFYRNPDGSEGTMQLYSGKLPKGAQMIIKEGYDYPNHKASDFYHHYKEDLALLAEMGFTALNLTMSWARIFPGGISQGINSEGVEYYRSVLSECKRLGMEPIVTLYKYDMPFFYVSEWGGWSNRRLIEEYVEFARVCLTEFKGLSHHWITFNELNILKLTMDTLPDVTAEDRQRFFEEAHNQLVASARVVRLAHAIDPDNLVGCMCAGLFGYGYTCDPNDQLKMQKYMQDAMFYYGDVMVRGAYPRFARRVWEENGVSLNVSAEDAADLMAGRVDFLPFSYYSSTCLTTHEIDASLVSGNASFSGVKNPYLASTPWGWEIDPVGFKIALHVLSDRYYDTPLLVVENGMGTLDRLEDDGSVHDPYRIEYLREHIRNMREAVKEGVNLIGYTMWSCIDLISAGTGEMRKRYGFIYVDAADDGSPQGSYKRYRKDSFHWYKGVCESNGEALAQAAP
ncbi:glycoside hydrolase family 1 protein [Olsenella massiliensis]|uniref:glycoside hydrolase family 1 protein n=1 Tax=Olsenella massiliensis TaxID=1622075 RepID=UPI00071E4838|nr:family 1 glycosylhydrolase [Olsenella massiliensis]